MTRPNRWTAPMVTLPMGTETRARMEQDWIVPPGVTGWWYIEVPKGYTADGATIPRGLWWLCGHPLEVPRVYAAIVHDYLYECGAEHYGMTRAEADAIYYALLRTFGWGRVRSAVEWLAIRIFGASHWRGDVKQRTKGTDNERRKTIRGSEIGQSLRNGPRGC